MEELLHSLHPAGNYNFHINTRYKSKVKLFAPHGGCIEPCTSKLTVEIANDHFDYFIFEGIRKKDCFQTLHVTSTNYNEPQCLKLVAESIIAVSIHGCDGDGSFIEIGGGNIMAIDLIHKGLLEKNYPVRVASQDRRGEDKNNFINISRRQGVQLELSTGFRKTLYADYPRTSQPNPVRLKRFVKDIQNCLNILESTICEDI